MSVCHDACQPPCSFGCGLRQKGVMAAPSATPDRMNGNPPPMANPAWERGIVTETRPGGHVVPVLNANMKPLRVKEYSQHRRAIDSRLRQIKNPT